MKERLEIIFIYLGKILNKQLKERPRTRLGDIFAKPSACGAFRLMSASVR